MRIATAALSILGIGAFLGLIARGNTRSVGAVLAGFGQGRMIKAITARVRPRVFRVAARAGRVCLIVIYSVSFWTTARALPLVPGSGGG